MREFFASTLFLVICAVIVLLLAVSSFLWAISSVELSFVDCNGHYSLDATNFRCQRAVWLTYAFWPFSILTILLLSATIIRARHRRLESRATKPPHATR